MKKSSKKMIPLNTLTAAELARIHTIGNDLGDIWTNYAAVDADGKVIAEGRVRTRARDLQLLYATLRPVRMVLETGTHSPWVNRILRGLGHEVVVANSRELSAIFKSKKKRDRVDARTLAKVGRVDIELLHPVKHRGEQAQRDVSMLRTRDVVVRTRTSLINAVRGSVKAIGERLPKCSADAFGARMKDYLPEMLRGALLPVVETIDGLTTQIRAYDKQIATLVTKTYPEAQRLMKINGVGALTALAFVLLIEDVGRFEKSRDVGSYFGLVPALRESGSSQPQMRITKQGDVLMRRLLVTAAQYILGKFGEDCDLRRHGLKLAERGGKNAKKRAVVAVARKLAVLMHTIWQRKTDYDPLFNAKKTTDNAIAA